MEAVKLSNEELVKHWKKIRDEGFVPGVYLKEAGYKGLGVFAKSNFEVGAILEMAHTVAFEWQARYLADPTIRRYSYALNCHCSPITPTRPPCLLNCAKNGNRHVMPLGFGCIYNSADNWETHNTAYQIFPDHGFTVYIARAPIAKDEECVTWFGQGYYDAWCKPFIPKSEKAKKK